MRMRGAEEEEAEENKTFSVFTQQEQLSNAGEGAGGIGFWARRALNSQNIYIIPQYSATLFHRNFWR